MLPSGMDRVLEVGGYAAAYCGRLFAQCGCEVVRVEPSAGEREGLAPRMEEPSAGEREGLAPRMEEPSAGAARERAAREGLAPRMEEPSPGAARERAAREGPAPRRKEPSAGAARERAAHEGPAPRRKDPPPNGAPPSAPALAAPGGRNAWRNPPPSRRTGCAQLPRANLPRLPHPASGAKSSCAARAPVVAWNGGSRRARRRTRRRVPDCGRGDPARGCAAVPASDPLRHAKATPAVAAPPRAPRPGPAARRAPALRPRRRAAPSTSPTRRGRGIAGFGRTAAPARRCVRQGRASRRCAIRRGASRRTTGGRGRAPAR